VSAKSAGSSKKVTAIASTRCLLSLLPRLPLFRMQLVKRQYPPVCKLEPPFLYTSALFFCTWKNFTTLSSLMRFYQKEREGERR
jgi:hypothetical protein